MIPVLFRYGSDYTLRKIYYLDVLSDPDMEFPQKLLGIRNRALNPRPVLFDQVHFLSESRFILRYRSLLYVIDEDTIDTNVLAFEMLNPRRPDEPMFIRDFHIQDNYLYVIDSYHDYVYRFDIGEYL